MLPDKGTRLVEEQLPPYVSYQQWKRLLDNLAIFMPSRFDASYFEDLGLSATNRSMLKGTLRFLGLMAPDGTPTPRLRELINSNAETQPKTLEATLRRAYAPLFFHLDLAHASRGQVKDYFKSEGIEGDIGRKCWSFFRRVAADAGIELSPPLDRANSGKRREKAGLQDPPPPQNPQDSPSCYRDDLAEGIAAKVPLFGPPVAG